jgi:hypothetical protein
VIVMRFKADDERVSSLAPVVESEEDAESAVVDAPAPVEA